MNRITTRTSFTTSILYIPFSYIFIHFPFLFLLNFIFCSVPTLEISRFPVGVSDEVSPPPDFSIYGNMKKKNKRLMEEISGESACEKTKKDLNITQTGDKPTDKKRSKIKLVNILPEKTSPYYMTHLVFPLFTSF